MKKNESLVFVRKAKSLLSHAHRFLIASVLVVACATPSKEVSIGSKDIGGTVTGPKGPEAGVWVIAETYDLPTRFAKIVVTDDHGNYLIPELPTANYKIWVRGYGLVDSQKKDAKPGSQVDLTAVKSRPIFFETSSQEPVLPATNSAAKELASFNPRSESLRVQ
jgi:hypothetical protein